MRTVTFVTQYEGPKKVHAYTVWPLISMVSSLGSAIASEECERILEKLSSEILTSTQAADIFALKNMMTNHMKDLDGGLVYIDHGDAYCLTQGTGMVFVRRGGQVKQIVADGQVAKGLAKDGDEFVVTTSEYLDFVGGLEGFRYYFDRYSALEVCEMMETYEDQSNPSGFVAVHIGVDEVEEGDSDPQVANIDAAALIEGDGASHTVSITDEPDGELIDEEVALENKEVKMGVGGRLKGLFGRHTLQRVKSGAHTLLSNIVGIRKLGFKKIAFASIFLLILFFVFKSVPFSQLFIDRDEEFVKFESKIDGYLTEADTLAFQNMSEVSVTLERARNEISILPEDDKKYFAGKLKALSTRINEKETELLKVSTAELEEYYSLSLLSEKISLTDVDTDDQNIYILDSVAGAVYTIGTDKRSQNIIKSDKLKGASQVAAYEGTIFVLTKVDGVFKIDETKSTQVLKPEKVWGKIVDMKLYASNIYMLDGEKGDVYKYPGIDGESFGTLVPYLVEESRGTLKGASAMSIYGPVYVVGESQVAKYVTGVRQDFVLELPSKNGVYTAFSSSVEGGQYFVYDNSNSAAYRFGEDGIFTRQYRGSSLKGAKNIVTTQDGSYLLTATKVLTIPEE